MKKKNILLMFVLLVAVLLPRVVSAAGTANNWEIYCGDVNKTVSKEDPVRCYLIAEITNDAEGKGIFGVLTGVRLNNKLEFVTGTPVGVLDESKIAVTPYNAGQVGGASNRTCMEASGCFDFTAKPNFTIADMKGANPGDAEIQAFNQDHSRYTIIGWYMVKLKDDATTDDCGEFCINVYMAATEADMTSPSKVNEGTLDNGLCKEIKPSIPPVEPEKKTCKTEGSGENIKYYGKDGNEVTKEQYDKDCGNPGTGGWASYAVLAAGAFIALSAITIAKKHNKFYQV